MLVNCLMCGYSVCTKSTYKERDKITKLPVQYYKCNNCTVEFVYPQMENLEELYSEGVGQKYGWKQQLVFRLPLSFRHKPVFDFLHHLERGTLLDIGCKEGKLTWLMQKRGWKVMGVEPTGFFAEFGNRVFGIKIENKFLQEIDSTYKFDLVVLSAVLEHLPDQVEFLKLSSRYMKEDGQMFVRVPHDESNWHAATHLYIHSAQSLGWALKKAGLYIVKMDKVGREWFVLCGKFS